MPAVERALDILEYCVERNAPVTIQEVTEKFDIPRASAFRIFRTLESRGYLVNTDKSFRYITGPRVLLLGNRITHEENLRQISNPHLYRLANETKQTVQLGVLFGYRVLYIDQIRTTTASDLFIEPTGTPFEVNISAGGKVMVALLPPEKRADFIAHAELASPTVKSVTDRDAFARHLVQVASQGFAVDDEEFAVGVRCVAAPIRDANGACVASIGVTGHISRLTDEALPGLIKATTAAASAISRDLGFA